MLHDIWLVSRPRFHTELTMYNGDKLETQTQTYILECDKTVETFALNGMWMSNDSSLRNQRMLNEYRLDISRTQQVTRYVQHVINTASYPQVAVSVTLCS